MRESVRQPVKKKPVAMKPFAALLALGLVCGAAAANLTCVKTPAEFVANLETIDYQQLDRPNVALFGSAAAPVFAPLRHPRGDLPQRVDVSD